MVDVWCLICHARLFLFQRMLDLLFLSFINLSLSLSLIPPSMSPLPFIQSCVIPPPPWNLWKIVHYTFVPVYGDFGPGNGGWIGKGISCKEKIHNSDELSFSFHNHKIVFEVRISSPLQTWWLQQERKPAPGDHESSLKILRNFSLLDVPVPVESLQSFHIFSFLFLYLFSFY